MITTDPAQPFKEKGHFNNYFLCGYKAILSEDSPVALGESTPPKGMNILIDSMVPHCAGLGSSGTFTVATAITTMHANGLTAKVDKDTLSALTIRAERMSGVAAGGMDQTVSIMSK